MHKDLQNALEHKPIVGCPAWEDLQNNLKEEERFQVPMDIHCYLMTFYVTQRQLFILYYIGTLLCQKRSRRIVYIAQAMGYIKIRQISAPEASYSLC